MAIPLSCRAREERCNRAYCDIDDARTTESVNNTRIWPGWLSPGGLSTPGTYLTTRIEAKSWMNRYKLEEERKSIRFIFKKEKPKQNEEKDEYMYVL